MNILVKYPTRQRPDLFLKTLEEWVVNQDTDKVKYLVSIDEDDESMTDDIVRLCEETYDDLIIVKGTSKNKIDACNRDIDNYTSYFKWDILLLISDDMQCNISGWDKVLMEDFKKHKDTNIAMWYHDGSKQKKISTLSCIGYDYYKSFGYVYHPSYKSFFCDNEYTEVAEKSGRLIKQLDKTLAIHQHPNWGGAVENDALYQENNKYWKEDQNNYLNRKLNNFL